MEVLNLNIKKSLTVGTIPATILKQTIGVHLESLARPRATLCKNLSST